MKGKSGYADSERNNYLKVYFEENQKKIEKLEKDYQFMQGFDDH